MNPRNYSRQSNPTYMPSPAIRAGLSVQELKAITAMRTSHNQDLKGTNNFNDLASTYDTATPEELQAAGILPVVIKDKARKPKYGSRAEKRLTRKAKKNILKQLQIQKLMKEASMSQGDYQMMESKHGTVPHQNIPTHTGREVFAKAHYTESKHISETSDVDDVEFENHVKNLVGSNDESQYHQQSQIAQLFSSDDEKSSSIEELRLRLGFIPKGTNNISEYKSDFNFDVPKNESKLLSSKYTLQQYPSQATYENPATSTEVYMRTDGADSSLLNRSQPNNSPRWANQVNVPHLEQIPSPTKLKAPLGSSYTNKLIKSNTCPIFEDSLPILRSNSLEPIDNNSTAANNTSLEREENTFSTILTALKPQHSNIAKNLSSQSPKLHGLMSTFGKSSSFKVYLEPIVIPTTSPREDQNLLNNSYSTSVTPHLNQSNHSTNSQYYSDSTPRIFNPTVGRPTNMENIPANRMESPKSPAVKSKLWKSMAGLPPTLQSNQVNLQEGSNPSGQNPLPNDGGWRNRRVFNSSVPHPITNRNYLENEYTSNYPGLLPLLDDNNNSQNFRMDPFVQDKNQFPNSYRGTDNYPPQGSIIDMVSGHGYELDHDMDQLSGSFNLSVNNETTRQDSELKRLPDMNMSVRESYYPMDSKLFTNYMSKTQHQQTYQNYSYEYTNYPPLSDVNTTNLSNPSNAFHNYKSSEDNQSIPKHNLW